MKNPWEKIYKGDRSGERFVVAEADRPYIEEFLDNKKYVPNEKHKLYFNMMSQQFIGNVLKAKVIFLSNNPRYDEDYLDQYLHTKGYENIVENNLRLTPGAKFHAFDLSLKKRGKYWSDKFKVWFPEEVSEKVRLNELRVNSPEEFGKKEKELNDKLDEFFTENIAIVDFFPYYSLLFDKKCEKLANKDYLPTQKFVFEILKKRIEDENDDVVIILLRGRSLWHKAVPGLENYKERYHVTSWQNPSIKPECIIDVSGGHVKEKIERLIEEMKK
jgi:hypothetical protein